MTTGDTEAIAHQPDAGQPRELMGDAARPSPACGKHHLAGAEGTMEQMLNEALGRVAQHLPVGGPANSDHSTTSPVANGTGPEVGGRG